MAIQIRLMPQAMCSESFMRCSSELKLSSFTELVNLQPGMLNIIATGESDIDGLSPLQLTCFFNKPEKLFHLSKLPNKNNEFKQRDVHRNDTS